MKKIYILFQSFLIIIPAFAQDSLNVRLVYHWDDTTLVGSDFYDNTYNEIWGFTQGGREYAVIGSTAGTHIFDITNPLNVDTSAFIPGAVQGPTIVHRNFFNYKGYLYMVSDEGASTLQIADISTLPDSVQVVYDSNALFSKSHNTFIDSAKARLYTCGGNNNNGIRVFSLTDPVNPLELVNFTIPGGYVHDAFVRNDTAYLNAGNNGLFIYDMSVITSPQLIGSLTAYPDKGYNHSGWLSKDGTIYAFSDETWGMDVKICDVSNLSNITVLSQINSNVDSNSINHNLIIRDNFLFLSYYYDGLQIFNIADPANPMRTGYYDTYALPNLNSYKGAWGVYPLLPSGLVLISDMQSGLYVFDVSDATGIDQSNSVENEWINVSPNPFTDQFQIQFSRPFIGDVSILVYDLIGKRAVDKKFDSADENMIVSMSDYPPGMYLIIARTQNREFHQKLVKYESK